MNLSTGEFLFKKGEPCKALYILRSGSLLSFRKKNRQIKILETFSPGSIVGGLPLNENSKEAYSVKAKEDSCIDIISAEEFRATLKETPIWFLKLIHFLQNRLNLLVQKEQKIKAILSLPAFLFTLDSIIKTKNSKTIFFSEIFSSLDSINSSESETIYRLCQGLHSLGLFTFDGKIIEFTKPKLPSLLYTVLQERTLNQNPPDFLLSIKDQMILETFVKAASQNETKQKDGLTEILGKSYSMFAKAYARGNRKTFQSLTEKNILSLIESESGTFDEDKICGDLEHIQNLLELNRIYPLLDHELAKHL